MLSDDDSARLGALLAQPPHAGRALPPDRLHGMLWALAIGPDDFPSTDAWMPFALGLGDGASPPGPELQDLLARFAAQVRADAAAGRDTPRLATLRRGRRDYRSWCEGFMTGVDVADSDWHDYAEPGEVATLLAPIALVAGRDAVDPRLQPSPEQRRRRLLEAEAGLGATLARLRTFWEIVRRPPATQVREAPKVGRNAACPCGSGRKFKQCHGRG